MSHLHRLRLTGRIFFVNVNLRPKIKPFRPCEYPLMIEGWEASRRRRWSSYNNFARDNATAAACPIQIDYVRLPEGYRA